MTEFGVGDLVRELYSEDVGQITREWRYGQTREWMVEYPGGATRWILEKNLELIRSAKPPKKVKTCTCGAAHTSNPKYHYDWCDLK